MLPLVVSLVTGQFPRVIKGKSSKPFLAVLTDSRRAGCKR
jgi:hypothetical protein